MENSFFWSRQGFQRFQSHAWNRHPVWYRYGLRQNEEREKKRCVEDRQKRRNEDEPWLEMVEGSNDLTYIFSMMSFLPTEYLQTIYLYTLTFTVFLFRPHENQEPCGMCMLLLPYICTFCITRPVVREGGRTTAKGRRAAPERRSLAAMNGWFDVERLDHVVNSFWLSSWDLLQLKWAVETYHVLNDWMILNVVGSETATSDEITIGRRSPVSWGTEASTEAVGTAATRGRPPRCKGQRLWAVV